MAADSGGINEPLQLEPFIHQVGGHSSMLQLDEDTICKPLIPQELNFYKTAPDKLKEFLAEYRGVIEVTFSEAVDGYLDLVAYMPSTYKTSPKRQGSRHNSLAENEHKTKHRIRLCQSGNIQIESVEAKKAKEESNIEQGQNGKLFNPWVIHCHQEQMKKLWKSSSTISQKYILLENRVSKFEFPCILDIKMGTRQYGDTASLAKRTSHTAKAAASTSAILGIRISGMQVYHQESGRYTCHNKYYGRSLTVDGFHQALYNFLYDGTKVRQCVISALLEKLHKLYSVVQSLNTFRFFTSSLLIIYDGNSEHYIRNNKNACGEQSITLQLSDNGNIADKQKETKESQSKCCDKGSASSDTTLCINHKIGKSIEKAECEESLPVVDLCMIDFAHSTHSKMPNPPVTHEGPDEGYLFGLENLIAHLKEIQRTEK
ncbi:inositol hexakisphosphate kinase 3-like [Stegodyphus dumicola]|uniref:inositol hexakisphosphate kinase 3-like n=1 Tax=Stegodyphus dumicola TaxID=202533 RepID=UPI0015B32400|nr:inositol hexakisphosphate kinase 3-like [Stegodyphus dumicola]